MKKIVLLFISIFFISSCSIADNSSLKNSVKDLEINNERDNEIKAFNNKIKCEGYWKTAKEELNTSYNIREVNILFYSPERNSCIAGWNYHDGAKYCYGIYDILNKEKKGICWTFEGYKSYIEDVLKYDGEIYIN